MGIRVVCPECGTKAEKESETEAFNLADEHNESRHNGQEVAGVVKEDVTSASEMLESARKNMDDEDWMNFIVHLGQQDPMGVRE